MGTLNINMISYRYHMVKGLDFPLFRNLRMEFLAGSVMSK